MGDRIMRAKQLTLSGEDFDNAAAGTTADISIYLKDKSGKILLADGLDVPANATAGYAKGCLFIDRNVATGITGLYENIGTSASCNFNAIGAVTAGEIALATGSLLLGTAGVAAAIDGSGDGKILVGNGTTMTSVSLSQDVTITNAGVATIAKINNLATAAEVNQVCDGNTATAAEIIAAADISEQAIKVVPATVMNAAIQSSVRRTGNIIKTEIAINLTGLKSTATTNDIIGDTGVCYIAQITTAVNGVIIAGRVNCGVVPTTGDDDIDLWQSSAATGAYDADASGLANAAALMTAGGAHAVGTVKPLTALPTANYYLYLTTGDTTAGTYAGGKLFIELWGTAA